MTTENIESTMKTTPHENDGKSLGEIAFWAISKEKESNPNISGALKDQVADEAVAAEVRRRDGDKVRELEEDKAMLEGEVIDYKTIIEGLKAEVKQLNDELLKAMAENVSLQTEIEKHKVGSQEYYRVVAEMGKTERELKAEIERLRGIRERQTTEITRLLSLNQKLTGEVERLKGERAAWNDGWSKTSNIMQRTICEQKADIDKLREELELAKALANSRTFEIDSAHKAAHDRHRFEEFTKAAMQGLCASPDGFPNNNRMLTLATNAVKIARDTLAALDAETTKQNPEQESKAMQYTGHTYCHKCGHTHWIYGECKEGGAK